MKPKERIYAVNALPKPDGGYISISVTQLCMVTWARQRHLIDRLAFRTYFACHELVKRRMKLDARQKPEYTSKEIANLIGKGTSQEKIRFSLKSLHTAGLLTPKKTSIEFDTTPDRMPMGEEDITSFQEMLDKIENNCRKVPLPRRIIRLIAAGATPSVVAAILGHALRCLYIRNNLCTCQGTCKASWIADVFNIPQRCVNRGRAHLIEIGWLTSLPSEQWHKNRYGLLVEVNLRWSGTIQNDVSSTTPVDNSQVTQTKLSTPPTPLSPKLSAPLLNQHPLQEYKNQNPSKEKKNKHPAFGGPAGVKKPKTKKKSHKLSKRWTINVTTRDLRDDKRLFALFDWAVHHHHVHKEDRLSFVASAVRASQVGSINPAGLFVWLVTKRLWGYITAEQEDEAQARIKKHLYGYQTEREEILEPSQSEKRLRLSKDAQLVDLVQKRLWKTGVNVFLAIQRHKPDFTRDRYLAAIDEIARSKQRETEICHQEIPSGFTSAGTILDEAAGIKK